MSTKAIRRLLEAAEAGRVASSGEWLAARNEVEAIEKAARGLAQLSTAENWDQPAWDDGLDTMEQIANGAGGEPQKSAAALTEPEDDAALRAAIWAALRPKLHAAGYSAEATPLLWREFREAVEGAVPLAEPEDIPTPQQPTEDVPY